MDIRNHYTLTKPYYFFHFKTSNFKLHRRCGEGPVGMLEEVGRHEGRSTVGCLHPTTSTLPVGDAMDYVSDNFGAAAADERLWRMRDRVQRCQGWGL